MSNSREHRQPQQYEPVHGGSHDRSLASLARTLAAEDPEPLSCAECREHLPALYHLQAEGATLPTLCQAVLVHLRSCPDCAAEFEALQTVLGELHAGTLPELAATPTFDLSFMGSPAPEAKAGAQLSPQPSLWQPALGERVWRLFTDLSIWLRGVGANGHTGDTSRAAAFAAFGALPPLLVPTPLPAAASAAFRTDAADWRPEVLMLPTPDAQLSIHLAVGPMVADRAMVMVKLLAVPSEQPLGDVHITLRNAQRQLLMGLVTKPDGTAVFEQLPLGRYLVQVRHDKHVWEIPLVIVAGSPPV